MCCVNHNPILFSVAQDLSEKVETERGNIAHINGMCEELAKAGHVDLLKDSAKLNEHWDTTTRALQDRITDIEKGEPKEIFNIILLVDLKTISNSLNQTN